MKKRLLSVLLAVLLVAALLPTGASAASSFENTYFPNGKISTPMAPYLVYTKNDLYGDLISMWYTPSEELRTLEAADERRQDSDKELEEYFGVYDYGVSIQIDAKIDNGAWRYTSDWDAPGWSGTDAPYYLAFLSYEHPGANAFYEQLTLSDLAYLGDSDHAFLEPAVYAATNEDGDTRYHYDLSGHTLSVRYRYAVCILPEYGQYDMVFSDWSPVTSIGKNGTQKTHTAPASLAAPVLSEFSIVKYEDGGTAGSYFIDIPDSVYDALLYCEADMDAFEPLYLQAQMRINGGEWANVYTANPSWIYDGFRSASPDGEALRDSDAVEVRVRIESGFLDMVSPWSNIVGTKTYTASGWAQTWVAQADGLGLLPDCLVGQDLKQKITRLEFAALAVRVYEKMSGNSSVSSGAAFADCSDSEVLKAVAIGITNGTDTAKNLFSPNANITREQCAAMLARAYKATAFEGWTLAKDADFSSRFKAGFTMPALFDDDARISAYAKDSVYFMAANGIINGVGNNMFAPKADTTISDAYGMATREQALKIAVGMVQNLK